MIQYTSGTTGFPKGALLHHRGLANNGADTAERMGIDPGDVFITTMPLFHTGGCVCCVLGAVSKAVTQVLVEAFEPGLVLELLVAYRGNAMLGVPTMLVALLEHPAFATTDLKSVKAICSGGSTVPAALVTLLEQKLGAPFTIVFGQTECSPVAAQTLTTDTIEDKAGTIGLPLPQHGNQNHQSRYRGDLAQSAKSASSARAAITSCSAISKCRMLPPPRSMPTAGCIPAISARWTRAAIARWRAA